MNKMDQLSKMTAWEEGELDDDTIALFQELIDSKLAWKLQGCYSRMAKQLIERGYCHDQSNYACAEKLQWRQTSRAELSR